MADQRKRKHLIIPIFIPFQGCPHRCVYCEQEKITHQVARSLDKADVQQILEMAIRSAGFDQKREPEIAFYGGTFTRLPFETMEELLGAVTPYLGNGVFKSIRVSTRPDAVDERRLELLKQYQVSTVELGAQSMNDDVLALAKRGHTAEDTVRAVRLLKDYEFHVGIQLMPGLPGDSEEGFLKTVHKTVDLRPDMVRLYPTVVIQGTELAQWYHQGKYRPLELEEAVRVCKRSCVLLGEAGIPVIRVGLMSSPSFQEERQIIAGPWHEAFGHLVRSEIHFDKILPHLQWQGEAARVRLRVPSNEIPLVKGFKNEGLCRVEDKTGAKVVEIISDGSVPSGQVRVERL